MLQIWIKKHWLTVSQNIVILNAFIDLYFNIQKCLFVWPLIDSTTGHHRNMRPVSIEPEWSQVQTFEKKLPSKWSVAKLAKSNVSPLMLFYEKSLK